jgi:hypothetical protein
MTDSNRLQLAVVRESTLGTTPTTPRMRIARITGESLTYRPDFVMSEELRSDRMNADPIKVGETNEGTVNFEWQYPKDASPLSEMICSALFADWTKSVERDNDGTADSIITDVAETGGVITVATGAAFVVGHLIRTTGFTAAGNNGLFRITTGSATVPAVGNSLLTDEAAPPGTARVKVIGFQGVASDINATATGLSSSTLNFTTLGLAVGQWVKIGGTGAAFRFVTAALNGWARVTAIAANALTLDNLPVGWTTETGTDLTIRVFFGDRIKNGTTTIGMTIERGFLGQTVPTYIVQRGMVVGELTLDATSKQKLNGVATFLGMGGAQSTTTLDASPDAAPSVADYPIMAANVNVGRIAEAGAAVAAGNWVRAIQVRLNNNLRALESVDEASPVDIGDGAFDVEVTADTYFGSNSLYTKLLAGTVTNMNFRVAKENRALVFGFPRLTAMEGNPNASGRNTDVMLPLRLSASYDSATAAHMLIDRLEYYQD